MGLVGTTVATQINFFIMWISLFVTSIRLYRQKKTEAIKDESLESANEHLRKMALIDELTGLASMPFFMKRASEILNEPAAKPGSKIFLYLDIENFKAINEKYGFEFLTMMTDMEGKPSRIYVKRIV